MTTCNYNDLIICVVTPEQLEYSKTLEDENMWQGQTFFFSIYNIRTFEMNN